MSVAREIRSMAVVPAEGKRWVERLARFGLVAKGAVYLLVGVLAVQFARGDRGRAADSKSALLTVADEPFGSAILAALAIGLFGYALWCAVQAVSDPQGDGSDAKGLTLRAGKLGKCLIYGATAVFAGGLAIGSPTGAGSDAAWTARLLAMPLGEVLVAIIGLFFAGAGVFQIYLGITSKFFKDLRQSGMGMFERRFILALGKAGHIARGIVFLLLGWLVVKAARESDPSEARGMGGAIDMLAAHDLLLGFVAVGLVAYGFYHVVSARHWQVRT